MTGEMPSGNRPSRLKTKGGNQQAKEGPLSAASTSHNNNNNNNNNSSERQLRKHKRHPKPLFTKVALRNAINLLDTTATRVQPTDVVITGPTKKRMRALPGPPDLSSFVTTTTKDHHSSELDQSHQNTGHQRIPTTREQIEEMNRPTKDRIMGDCPSQAPKDPQPNDEFLKREGEATGRNEVTPEYPKELLEHVPERDPNKFYKELDAWKYHNPPLGGAVTPENLSALPPREPLPLDDFPQTGQCDWRYDEEANAVYASFSKTHDSIHKEDLNFFLDLMERDDIALVSEGLVGPFSKNDLMTWTLPSLLQHTKDPSRFHEFRRFQKLNKNGKNGLEECPEIMTMRLEDFAECLTRQETQKRRKGSFEFRDGNDKKCTLKLDGTALELSALNMDMYATAQSVSFLDSFRIPGILPGGTECLLSNTNESSRPLRSPNLRVSQPGTFVRTHQKGHGSVDSEYVCLHGTAQAFMLRRLPERHKLHALSIIIGPGNEHNNLYNVPSSGMMPRLTDDKIRQLKEMNYYPSSIVLAPGQHLHVGKGKLHSFQMLVGDKTGASSANGNLPISGAEASSLYVGVEWNWMFGGRTLEGVEREVMTMLESVETCQRYNLAIPATPELCITKWAQKLVSAVTEPKLESFVGMLEVNDSYHSLADKSLQQLAGLYPGLRLISSRNIESIKSLVAAKKQGVGVVEKPNCWDNPMDSVLDPYGYLGFACMLCHRELANSYLHCVGCEEQMNFDFNICMSCHEKERYKITVRMRPDDFGPPLSDNCHTGAWDGEKSKPCLHNKNGKCSDCGRCTCCSCVCHTKFKFMFRFHTVEQEEQMLAEVEQELKHRCRGSPISFAQRQEAAACLKQRLERQVWKTSANTAGRTTTRRAKSGGKGQKPSVAEVMPQQQSVQTQPMPIVKQEPVLMEPVAAPDLPERPIKEEGQTVPRVGQSSSGNGVKGCLSL